jgi:hypothetical protein
MIQPWGAEAEWARRQALDRQVARVKKKRVEVERQAKEGEKASEVKRDGGGRRKSWCRSSKSHPHSCSSEDSSFARGAAKKEGVEGDGARLMLLKEVEDGRSTRRGCTRSGFAALLCWGSADLGARA